MAKQTINLGTSPTGSGGDTNRSAFVKAQANFDELYASYYAAKGANSDITSLTGLTTALAVTKGGTGATTAAAARTALGLKTAALADIVGTASQSGGIPTGAIIEKGGTAAGFYTKFADGTLIQWGYTAPLTIDITNLHVGSGGSTGVYFGGFGKTFPIPFYTFPSVSAYYQVTANIIWASLNGDTATTGVNIYLVSNVAINQAGTFYWQAIGRWY